MTLVNLPWAFTICQEQFWVLSTLSHLILTVVLWGNHYDYYYSPWFIYKWGNRFRGGEQSQAERDRPLQSLGSEPLSCCMPLSTSEYPLKIPGLFQTKTSDIKGQCDHGHSRRKLDGWGLHRTEGRKNIFALNKGLMRKNTDFKEGTGETYPPEK